MKITKAQLDIMQVLKQEQLISTPDNTFVFEKAGVSCSPITFQQLNQNGFIRRTNPINKTAGEWSLTAEGGFVLKKANDFVIANQFEAKRNPKVKRIKPNELEQKLNELFNK